VSLSCGRLWILIQTLFYLGNAQGVRPLFGGQYSLVFRCFFFLSNYQLATFHSEAKNRRYRVFLDYKLTKLVWGSQQTPHYKILFGAIFGKVFYKTRQCFEGMKHSLFIFISHSLLSFGSWVNLKVLTFDFEWFSSKVYCELETKTALNFSHFLSSLTVTSQVLFPTLSSGNADGDGDAETCEKAGERRPLWREFTNIKQHRREPRFPHCQAYWHYSSSVYQDELEWPHWKKFAINSW